MVVMAVIIPAITGHAADVRIMSRNPGGGCNLSLKGPIEIGDLKKVSVGLRELDREFRRQLADASLAELWSRRNPSLCLDSAGGSYPEGLRIAELLIAPGDHLRTGVGTSIDAGSQCLSACALIFMAGQVFDRGGERLPSRVLDVRGKLGFHAPHVPVTAIPEKQYDREEIVAVHMAAVRSLAQAIKLFSFTIGEQSSSMGRRPWVRPTLLAEMLGHASNEVFLIDTVGKAGRWDIDLGGVRYPTSLDSNKLKTACSNFLAWQEDSEVLSEHTPVDPISREDFEYPQELTERGVSVFKFTYNRGSTICAVAPHVEHDPQRPGMPKRGGRIFGLKISIFHPGQRYDYPVDFPTWGAENARRQIGRLAREN
jgi:hypothetical protein